MEIFDTAGPESAGNEKEKNSRIGKSALRVFATGATIIYGCALAYCYSTGHVMESGMLAVAYVVVGFLAFRVYKSL